MINTFTITTHFTSDGGQVPGRLAHTSCKETWEAGIKWIAFRLAVNSSLQNDQILLLWFLWDKISIQVS